ncbi:MAG: sugar-binding protein, partial [Clostridia bacterium]|nr:sugar-binding protein [Clostridia bacterium]
AVIDLGLSYGMAYTGIKNSEYMTAMARMKKPPVIDGTLSYGEWNKSMPMLINNESQIRLQPDWSGPDDLSAKIYCAYDEDNFYIGAEVTDDVLYDEDELARAWACDSIQFAFAKKNIASAVRTEYGIAMVNGVPKVDRYSFIGVNTGIINEKDVETYEGVELQVKREGSRTIYEAKFPWEQIYGEETDVTRLDEVYFSVLVNENDGAGRNGWLEYCGGIGDSKNAALFIPVTLDKK